jgi:hypothetical protein
MTWSTTRAVRVGTVEVEIEVEIVSERNVPASEHVESVARAVEATSTEPWRGAARGRAVRITAPLRNKNPGCLRRVGAGDIPYRRLAPR